MPATDLTTECRAVAERMRAFPIMEGNVPYLRKIIYEDSAKVTELITEVEALEPPADEAVVQKLYQAASVCGSAGEVGGNVMTYPAFEAGADALIAACDLVEAAPEAKAERSKRTRT